MSRKSFGLLRQEKGASAIEFALVLPILVLMVFGIFQFGLAYRNYLAITHAAREGARMAAVGRYDQDLVIKRAYPVVPSAVSVTYLTADGQPFHGAPVEVVVSSNLDINVPLFRRIQIPLVSRAQMRVEY